jgi:nitrogen regulatory protein PII-like uncharacterized protein
MINYYKGNEMYLSVNSDNQHVIVLVNHVNDKSIRLVTPAVFYNKIAEDITSGILTEINEEEYTSKKIEVLAALSSI